MILHRLVFSEMFKFVVVSVLVLALAKDSAAGLSATSRFVATGVKCPKPEPEDLCSQVICDTNDVPNEPPKMTVGCEFKEQVNEFWLHYAVHKKDEKTGAYRMISWKEEDVCDKMKRLTSDGIQASIIYKMASRYTSNAEEFLHACPFEKGWTIMKDFQTKDVTMPPFLQNGEYYADFRYFNGLERNTTIYKARYNFMVSPYERDDDNKLNVES